MLAALIAIIGVSSIAASLAAVLVIAQRFIANYGECRIYVNGEDKVLTVDGGSSLLESLGRNGIFIPSACGGRGTCAYCKVKVVDGAGPVVPTEEPYLSDTERAEGVRLSCQVKVRQDIRVEIPPALLEVKEYPCICEDITDLTYDIKQFRFRMKNGAEMDYTAGQYVQLFCPVYNKNDEVYRAYSISSDPSDPSMIELVIRLVPEGICTTWCFDHLKVGDDVLFNGPHGNFRLTDSDAPMVFVAGGSGMAPMKCILHHMKNQGIHREVTYFFGANKVDELFYVDLLRQFEKDIPGFRFVPVVSRPPEGSDWDGETGLVTEAVARNIKDLSGHEGYLCGSPGMIDAASRTFVELGMHEDRIYYDKFA